MGGARVMASLYSSTCGDTQPVMYRYVVVSRTRTDTATGGTITYGTGTYDDGWAPYDPPMPEVDLPVFEAPVRPVGPRTRVRIEPGAVLAPKRARMATAVAWVRGRVPRGASDRVRRLLGLDRRR